MKNEQQTPYHTYTWLCKFIGGAVVGLANSTLTTPLVNYTNHMIDAKKHLGKHTNTFTYARALDGILCYNIAFVLRIGVALPLNSLFLHHLSTQLEIEKKHTLLASIVAGGIAGSVATLPEAIAQTQQLQPGEKKPSSLSVIKEAYRYNGGFSLNRGMFATVGRSAGFTAGYLGLMPLLCELIRKNVGDHIGADVFSAMVCGPLISSITTPFNTLRFEKQDKFMQKGAAPTYSKILNDIFHSNAIREKLFVGFKPRTMIATFSMFLIHEGNKVCNAYTKDGFPDLLGPK